MRIIVEVSGGVVQNIIKPDNVSVHVHDYDVDGTDDLDLETDENGDKYFLGVW